MDLDLDFGSVGSANLASALAPAGALAPATGFFAGGFDLRANQLSISPRVDGVEVVNRHGPRRADNLIYARACTWSSPAGRRCSRRGAPAPPRLARSRRRGPCSSSPRGPAGDPSRGPARGASFQSVLRSMRRRDGVLRTTPAATPRRDGLLPDAACYRRGLFHQLLSLSPHGDRRRRREA